MSLQELFADPNSWTQKTNARVGDPVDGPIALTLSEGTCFCLHGGLCRLFWLDTGEREDAKFAEAEDKLDAVLIARGYRSAAHADGRRPYICWNDEPGRTIEQVRQLVAEAGV